MAGERRFTQPKDLRRHPTRVRSQNPFLEMTKDEDLVRRRTVPRSPGFAEREEVGKLPARYREMTPEEAPPGTVTPPPGETTDTPPPEPPPYFNPLWQNYGQDWLSRLNLASPDMANDMAMKNRLELFNALMGAQYGNENLMNDRFGGYLRGQAQNIADLFGAFDSLAGAGGQAMGGGAAARGGAYRTFEDMYESLMGGSGQAGNISDWRNMIYGGAGAAAPGGYLQQNILPTETMGQASSLLGDLQPVLSSTLSPERWQVLQNLMPTLWNRYNATPGGGGEGTRTPWLAWLQQGGYLPNVAY